MIQFGRCPATDLKLYLFGLFVLAEPDEALRTAHVRFGAQRRGVEPEQQRRVVATNCLYGIESGASARHGPDEVVTLEAREAEIRLRTVRQGGSVVRPHGATAVENIDRRAWASTSIQLAQSGPCKAPAVMKL